MGAHRIHRSKFQREIRLKKLLALAVVAAFSITTIAGAAEVTRSDEVRVAPEVQRDAQIAKKKVKRTAKKAKKKTKKAARRTRAAAERGVDRVEAAGDRARDN